MSLNVDCRDYKDPPIIGKQKQKSSDFDCVSQASLRVFVRGEKDFFLGGNDAERLKQKTLEERLTRSFLVRIVLK